MPLIERIREEISLIKPSPGIYTLSCLYTLFENTASDLSEKDRLRLSQWREEAGFAAFSDRETQRFMADFDAMLLHERFSLLLRNPVERLAVISAGVDHWIEINLDILSRDSVSAVEMLEKIKRHQDRILQLKTVMKSTLDGALQKIRQDIKTDVDRFFDIRNGQVLSGILGFIRQYAAAMDPFQEKIPKTGFTQALFLVFQEFKHSLDTFVTESTMPEVIRFVREEEAKITDYMQTIAAPYDGLLQDTLCEYRTSLNTRGVAPAQDKLEPICIPDLDAVKSRSGLRLPSAGVTLRYSTRIKTEAVVKLGCYTLVTLVKRLLKQSVKNRQGDEIHALKDGVDRMKRETERSIVSHFKDYRENLKFQYMLKLADAAFLSLLECLTERFDAYSTDTSRITHWADGHRTDKDQVARTLNDMRQKSREISEQLKSIRENMAQSELSG